VVVVRGGAIVVAAGEEVMEAVPVVAEEEAVMEAVPVVAVEVAVRGEVLAVEGG
jgi:hypothetical protein